MASAPKSNEMVQFLDLHAHKHFTLRPFFRVTSRKGFMEIRFKHLGNLDKKTIGYWKQGSCTHMACG